MSVATSFKHPRPFPITQNLTGFGQSDYIALTVSEDDPPTQAGLTEAKRIYWDIEAVTFTPVATKTGGLGNGFSKVFGLPAVTTEDSVIWNVTSVILDGAGIASAKRPPRNRVVPNGTFSQYIMSGQIFYESGIEIQSDTLDGLYWSLAFVDDEWRLYYVFRFNAAWSGGFASIVNPANAGSGSGGAETGSGTFTIFGYELDFLYDGDGIDDCSLSATSLFYTYAP